MASSIHLQATDLDENHKSIATKLQNTRRSLLVDHKSKLLLHDIINGVTFRLF